MVIPGEGFGVGAVAAHGAYDFVLDFFVKYADDVLRAMWEEADVGYRDPFFLSG